MDETPEQAEERIRLGKRQLELQDKLVKKEGDVKEIYIEYMLNTKFLKNNHNINDNGSRLLFYPYLKDFSKNELDRLDNDINTKYAEKTKSASSGGKKSKKRRSTKRRSTKRKRPTKKRKSLKKRR